MATDATTEPLLTISAFARAVDLAPSTLRYYDEAGLLTPAEVDPRTGYRYYTPDLERRATLIRRMREVGLSVDAMRLVLAGGHDEATRILRAHVEGAHRSAARAAAVVDEILAALDAAPEPAEVSVTVDGAELAAALRRVGRAASDDDPLAGVLLDCADGAVTVVATDRYWLALWSVPVGEPGGDLRAFLPTVAARALAELLASRVTATLRVSPGSVQVDETELAAGPDRFPAYRLILPGRAEGRATLERAALAATVDAAIEEGPAGPVRFAVSDSGVRVGGYGDADQVMLPAVVTGATTTLWFAAGLFRRALDTLVGESVTVAWTAQDRAVRISPVEQRRLDVLLMPVRPPR
ncbi:MerR family transcriptional regulator [Nocardioides sp.]|uniref:MerR family transcriptional regulator n=1 Tax=Nocardioides sp. TaxID=35761 RepID=UPI002ECFE1AD